MPFLFHISILIQGIQYNKRTFFRNSLYLYRNYYWENWIIYISIEFPRNERPEYEDMFTKGLQ